MIRPGRFVAVLIVVGLACGSVPRVAHADPPDPAAVKKFKRPAAPPPPRKPKPAPAPKEAPKHAAPEAAPHAAAGPATHEVVEHESRIEFDERMVHGQSAAGAIFLFQRAPSDLKSIVEVPDSFRAKTVELVQRRGTP